MSEEMMSRMSREQVNGALLSAASLAFLAAIFVLWEMAPPSVLVLFSIAIFALIMTGIWGLAAAQTRPDSETTVQDRFVRNLAAVSGGVYVLTDEEREEREAKRTAVDPDDTERISRM